MPIGKYKKKKKPATFKDKVKARASMASKKVKSAVGKAKSKATAAADTYRGKREVGRQKRVVKKAARGFMKSRYQALGRKMRKKRGSSGRRGNPRRDSKRSFHLIHKRDTGQSFYPVELSDDLTQEVLDLSVQKKNLEITLNEIRWPSIPVSDKQIKS